MAPMLRVETDVSNPPVVRAPAMTLRPLLLPVALVVGLSACSSSRSTYPNSRTIPTPNGNVIVMDDGRVYRDRDRDGRPDVYEDGTYGRDRNGRTSVCHRGRTLTVSGSAVRAHVNHGDYVGACGSGGVVDRNGNGRIDDDERYDRNRDGRIDERDERRNGDSNRRYERDDDDRRERASRTRKHDRRGRDRDDD